MDIESTEEIYLSDESYFEDPYPISLASDLV